ncbi:MAG: flagellar motor switch protein FliM [Planctomycetota bacterium]|jgi:flagellar motor switch protein FliM
MVETTAEKKEVKSAAEGAKAASRSGPPPEMVISVYDPRKPNRLSRTQLNSLSKLFSLIAEDLSAELEEGLRMEITTTMEGLYQDRYVAFMDCLDEQASIYQIIGKPMNMPLFCVIDHSLVYAMVDRYFGGSGEEVSLEARDLTTVEVGVADEIVKLLMGCCRERWKRLGEFTVTESELLGGKSRIEAVDDKDTVLVVDMNVIGPREFGSISLCFPFGALEHYLEQIAALEETDPAETEMADVWRGQIEQGIAEVEVGLPVVLGEAEIPLAEIVNLKIDDVVVLDRKISEPVEMIVGSRSVIRGNIGIYEDRLALKVSEVSALEQNPAELESIHG